MAFTKIAKEGDVEPGTARVFDVGDRSIAVCNVGGEVYAVDNVCTHDEGPLGEGEMEGYEVECPRHGARFDVRDGSVASMPAIVPIGTFEVREQGGRVQVAVATAAAARTDDDW